MQTTMTSSICPLCKSPSGTDANPLPSRLCNQCRAMLSTILPQAVAGSVVIVDAQKSASEPQAAQYQDTLVEPSQPLYADEVVPVYDIPAKPVEVIAEPSWQSAAPDPEKAFQTPVEAVYFQTQEASETPSSAAAEAEKESFFFQTEEKPEAGYLQADDKLDNDYAAYLEAAQKFDSEYAQEVPEEDAFASPYGQSEEKFETISPQAAAQSEETSQPALHQFGFVNPPPKPLPYVEQLEKEPEMPSQGSSFVVAPEVKQSPVQENLPPQQAAPAQFYAPEPAPSYRQEAAPPQSQAQEAMLPYAPQSGQPAAISALQDMPYVWDNSVDNYPVLMVQEEKRSLSRPLLALAALALLALAAAGYWFIYKPALGGGAPDAQQRASKTAENNPPTAPPTSAPEGNSAAPQSSANASAATPTPATPEEKPATPDTAAANETAGQGKVSLQAASFPSEQGANEFSEKLKRSGIPAYIASANIAGKGKWYRVRVGRFVSTAEAEKYAAQAKQRAKATGLNLQLVVCDYANQ
jgi:cell division septation protein DedD